MRMSQADAELFYDGRIPAGAVDPRAKSAFGPRANAVRLVNVREKPGATVQRMFRAVERFALAGAVTQADLKAAGFTDGQIALHGPAVLRELATMYPGLDEEAAQ